METLAIVEPSIPTIFISHSEKDGLTAKALHGLMMQSFHLNSDEVRCTSARKLPAGSEVKLTLEQEAKGATVFVCLVTRKARQSRFVRLEVETRLKSRRAVLPVLGVGADPQIFPDLENFSALRCDNDKHLLQLVGTVSTALGGKLQPPDVVDEAVKKALSTITRVKRLAALRRLVLLGMLLVLGASALHVRYETSNVLSPPQVNPNTSSRPHVTTPLAPSRPPALPSAKGPESHPQPQTMPKFEPRTHLAFRKANGATAFAGPEANTLGALPSGTYAYVHARQMPALDRALLLKSQNNQTYEVQRTPDGALFLLGFVSERERVALGVGGRVTVTVRPTADELRHVLVSVPVERFETVLGFDDLAGPHLRIKLASTNRGH